MKKHQNKKFIPQNFTKYRDPTDLILEDINADSIGKVFHVKGMVEKITQTSGPTLFTISDGTGNLILKGFLSPGTRAFPEISELSTISATVKLNEYNGMFEGEIKKISLMNKEESKQFLDSIKELERERAKPVVTEFLVKNIILDKLKESFLRAATEIRLAIMQNRPIIVRHHNDADGYSAGYTLEKAIVPLIENQHKTTKAEWEFYTRAPCAAPFYEIEDSIKDTAKSLSNAAKFSNKMPLVIIADNGSSKEDLLGILQGKVHGMDFIVVDHHVFEEDVISKEVLVHINPFLVGEDGAKYSAGMLCTELARFINHVENIEQIPAMAGIADRINNPEVMEKYIQIAEKKNYSRELLTDIAALLDFVSAKLRFMEAREYIEVIFGEPREKQENLVNVMVPYIRNLEAKGLKIAKSTSQLKKLGKTTLQSVEVETTFSMGFYPKPGKCVGLLHDDLQLTKKITNLVTIGILKDAITIRATDEANFSVHGLIEFLQKDFAEAFVEGGGHKNAGTIKFVPSKQKEVLKLLEDFIHKHSK